MRAQTPIGANFITMWTRSVIPSLTASKKSISTLPLPRGIMVTATPSMIAKKMTWSMSAE